LLGGQALSPTGGGHVRFERLVLRSQAVGKSTRGQILEQPGLELNAGPKDADPSAQEGEALKRLLRTLVDSAVDPGSIRIISPFRDVVYGAKGTARTMLGDQFAKDNVGTIHTVQGQESDVVIIVLSSAPEREGARRWAAEKPNLLNVAVSRAKRRLYVVGDRSRWQEEQYFSVLSATLRSGAGSR